jgi:P27 family predicted phage terminase small subunit
MARRQCSCPSWLDDDACDEWRRLQRSGKVAHKDPETTAAYCFTLSLWRRMRAVVESLPVEGPSSWTTRDGQERPHPALAVEAQLAADLLALTEALDLEPVGRTAPKPSRVLFLDEGA